MEQIPEEILFSNAEKGIYAIKQEQASPEQWLGTLRKNGYLKAEEDKWLHLSDWLKSQMNKKKLSKKEIIGYIAQNKIRIEETILDANNNGLEKYSTAGIENCKELIFSIPNIESWNADDEIHYGNLTNGKTIAWIRFGEVVDTEKILIIDEIQSARHQNRRMKDADIPDAPFSKNWYEMAMKRIIRYAAEQNYTQIAWTTGNQQNERYEYSIKLDRLLYSPRTTTLFPGSIILQPHNYIPSIHEVKDLNELEQITGKKVAKEIENGKWEWKNIKIGNDGLNEFYDFVIPNFINKYCKKWGIHTSKIHIPKLGVYMHGIPVNAEMKEAVLNGQAMFKYITDNTSSFAQKHGFDEKDVKKYADSMRIGSLGGASYAFQNIKRKVRLDHIDKSLGEFIKIFAPIQNELYEKFGSIDELREEHVQKEMERRNVMEAARKRAEEEAEAERKRLEEFEVMSYEHLDSEYFKAIENNDENRMRDLVNEAARRNEYVSSDEFRMAHRAPSYDEEGIDKSMVNIANNRDQIRESLNEQLRMNRDRNREESAEAIENALSAIDKGEKPTVKIYRAVPKSLKESKVRNGDWVTLSKSYAEQHGNHALEGNFRIMEEDVPAENLYWDGNDINEWGYDDKSDYRYRNTKNNRKLNDLITRDDHGDIIPLSQRFNSRKSDPRYRFIGEKGAANLDKAEEATTRLDNLNVAREMEKSGKAKQERIEKLHKSDPVIATFNNDYTLDRKSAKNWLKENVRGEYINADTGDRIEVSKIGINEVTAHGSQDKVHLESLLSIPQMIEQSIFVDEISNRKDHDKYDSYRYYVCGIKIDGTDYTAKIVVGVKGDKKYYDHHLSAIEKGTLIDNLNGLSDSVAAKQNSFTSGIKDTKLLSILQTNEKETAQKIKLATGWEKGADGKWRYEEDDFEYRPLGDANKDALLKRQPWYDEFTSLLDRVINGEDLTNEEEKRLETLTNTAGEIKKSNDLIDRIYLDDYVKDNNLFKAYPELKTMTIVFGTYPDKSYAGLYDESENKIVVNLAKADDTRSVIAHEIQHAIQRIEGFALGGNTDMFNETAENVIIDIIDATKGKLLEEGGFDNTPQNIFSALNRATAYGGTILRDYSSELDNVSNKYGYETIFDLVNDIGKFKSSVQKYRSLSGEVEARNVQSRLNMTTEERRNSLASETEDVAREDQLFLNDALGVSVSMDNPIEEINKRFNEELEQQIAGKLPKGHVYKLGRAGNILKSAGIADLDIEMPSSRLQEKSNKDYKSNHPFDLSEVRNLPEAIQHPIAVFESETDPRRTVVLTELESKSKNFIAVLGLTHMRGRNAVEINSVISLYPKDGASRIGKWFDSEKYAGKNLLKWVDKEKALRWLSNNSSDVNSVGQSSKRIANIIENFENPNILEGEISSSIDELSNELGMKINKECTYPHNIIQQEIESKSKKLGAVFQNIKIIQDKSLLPDKFTKKMNLEGRYPGLFDTETGDVYLIINEISSIQEVEQILLHEVLGHKGIRALKQDKLYEFLDQVYQDIPEPEKTNYLRIHHGNRYIATEEYIADKAEDYHEPKIWDKIKYQFKNCLKNWGFTIPLSDKDIRCILSQGKKELEKKNKILSYPSLNIQMGKNQNGEPVWIAKLGDKMKNQIPKILPTIQKFKGKIHQQTKDIIFKDPKNALAFAKAIKSIKKERGI